MNSSGIVTVALKEFFVDFMVIYFMNLLIPFLLKAIPMMEIYPLINECIWECYGTYKIEYMKKQSVGW